MDESYLAHWGIKGMKWGIRRFRNKDGSLTPAGKSRYNDTEGESTPARKNRYYDDEGKSTPEGKALKRSVDNYNKALSGARNVVSGVDQIARASGVQSRNRYNNRKNLTQDEMSKMSDADLRALVNRLNLEQQYSNLTEDRSARSRVQTGLDYVEAALSITGGALSIAVAYKMLRG